MGITNKLANLLSHREIHSSARLGGKRRRTTRLLRVENLEDRRLLATIDLSTLTAPQGLSIYGVEGTPARTNGDQTGRVQSAGDVNGDGYDDMLVGGRLADAAGNAKNSAGESYIVFGSPTASAPIDLAILGTSGVTIYGANISDQSGFWVSGAGDLDGDGFDDILVGANLGDAPATTDSRGICYVIFGQSSMPATIDLSNLGSTGLTIYGADAGDQFGSSMSGAGDINGDGFDDFLVSAPRAEQLATKLDTGETYVIFGKASLRSSSIDLKNLGADGVTIYGVDAKDYSGRSVSVAGDVNGDGYDDIFIGADGAKALGNAKENAGESYLIYGGPFLPSTIELSAIGGSGITIFGADGKNTTIAGDNGDKSGTSVSGAGDVNGDGFDDLIIGAYGADGIGNAKKNSGESYLIFGSSNLPSMIDLASLGLAGVTIVGVDGDNGTNAGDASGKSVSRAGDVNGDGFDDVIIGAYKADAASNLKADAGESYVVFGGPVFLSTLDLASLGANGVTIFGGTGGTPGDRSGDAVSGAGDLNGDGFDDVLVGSFLADNVDGLGNTQNDAGEAYEIFGGNGFTSSVTFLGNLLAETLTGTSGANLMVAGGDHDLLIGNGGADVLVGGQGNDLIAISDLSFQRVIGGRGNDSLRLDGSNITLNLTNIADSRIQGIESIDISGSGNNSLILTTLEVTNLSDESNTLIVYGNSGDSVFSKSYWNGPQPETIGGKPFAVYTYRAATLKVSTDVTFIQGATVLNRQVFYNRSTSTVFGDGTGNPNNSIDPTRFPLLPGRAATAANYTNTIKGLNGLVIDVGNLFGTPTAADFQFATWEGISSSGFSNLPITPSITVIANGGIENSTRIKIDFPDYVVRNTWLRVTLLATGNTGLSTPDVFYFGNAVADMYLGNYNSLVTIRTNESDVTAVRKNQSTAANSVTISNIYDVNKDGRVNMIDTSLVRQNQSLRSIRYFTAPLSLRLAVAAKPSSFAALNTPSINIGMLILNTPVKNHSDTTVSTLPIQIGMPLSIVDSRSPLANERNFAENSTSNLSSVSEGSKPPLLTSSLSLSIDDFFVKLGRSWLS